MRTKLLLVIFCVGVLSCNKTTEKPLDIEHCHNKTKDDTEDGTDCGGACKPCVPVTPTCNFSNVVVNITRVSPQQTYVGTNHTNRTGKLNNNNEYVMSGTTEVGNYTITLSDAVPNLYGAYSIVQGALNNSYPYFARVSINGSYTSTSPNLNSGQLYMVKTGDTYYAIICNGKIESTYNYDISGKFASK